MDLERFASHLERPAGLGALPEGAFVGAAGGAACGDLLRVSLAVDPDDPRGLLADARFDARGCQACLAAGSALVTLLRGRTILEAATIGAEEIATELGGLSAAKRHVAELAADALHRALGAAARACRLRAPAAGRTVVAMSGGVDSAVAALLAAGSDGGPETVGLTLELWSDAENDGELSCCSAQAVRGARALAHGLGMPHISIDLRAEFRAGVVEPWLADHARGLTPNPCVRCNGSVRIDAMLALAERLGAQTLATGHYARLYRAVEPADGAVGRRAAEGEPLLRVAADREKDQSYVLAALPRAALARLRFPVGEMRKPDVRAHARARGLAVAGRRDSQDLCFLAGTGRERFLERHGRLGRRTGPILDRAGRALGEHGGTHRFTVGQRRGLGIGGGDPLYVLATDAGRNTVTVGPRDQLLAGSVELEELTLHLPARTVDSVKIRYRGRAVACRLRDGDLPAGRHPCASVELEEPIERTAPGQLACLYAGELLVGYGTIAA
jgi:tRNA-specific 2-thiouridylase